MCTRSDSLARSTRSRCIFVTTTRHGNECHTRFYAPRVCESSCLAHARLRRRLRSRCTGNFFGVVYRMFTRQSTQETQPGLNMHSTVDETVYKKQSNRKIGVAFSLAR